MSDIPLAYNLAIFAVAGAVVWIAGTRLTIYADVIGDRTGISKALIGFVYLALITQLPEIVTNTTAALQGNALLALNSMFGGITMQTAVLVAADLAIAHRALTYYAHRSINQLQGVLLILALALLLMCTLLGELELGFAVGLTPVLMAGFYVLAMTLLWRYDAKGQWRPVEIPEEQEKDFKNKATVGVADRSLSTLIALSAAAGVGILISGVLLVLTADAIAQQSGLGSSFIGVTLLASATSLPELSTTISAARLGAYNMAISDVFGSNLIMVFLLLPTDLFYRQGVLLSQADRSAQFVLVAGILLTAIYLVGLMRRSPRHILGLGTDSWIVLVTYLGSLVALYHLR